jgi:AcrR family transcriptional regulator
VAAAVDLLAREGFEGFSVRRLAGELDVDTMALYKHVRNKDDLLGAVVRSVFSTGGHQDGEWWEQVATTYRQHRKVIREHPWVLAVMLSSTLESAEPWEMVDRLLALIEPHVGAEGSARWVRRLSAYTNGFLLSEADVVKPSDPSQVVARFPRIAAAAARNGLTADADFDEGLDVLVTAMRDEAAARTPGRRPSLSRLRPRSAVEAAPREG